MSRAKFPSEEKEKFMLRMPEGLREKLASVAQANGRSMNSELITRIEASFDVRIGLESDIARMLEDFINAKVADRLREIASKIGA